MLTRHRRLLKPIVFTIAGLLLLALNRPAGKELFVASSPHDAALITRLRTLSPTVNPEEAEKVAYTAVTTGLELRRKWHVNGISSAFLPGLQNLLIKMGMRKGGYCFQYCIELLLRLDALKVQTLEFHWAESEVGTPAENNGIVVTARGQPFAEGIVLDNWRYQGLLAWTQVTKDPEYRWREGSSYAAAVRQANVPKSAPSR